MYIEITNLSFRFRNSSEPIIDNFELTANKGEIISILGQSGSGKSTFLRLLAGLEKPYSGTIAINNQVLFDSSTFVEPEDRGVGMVFQDYALFPNMTVEKNITFGLGRLKQNERIHRCKEVLELVDLKELSHRYPYELSGGQQQRVALARTLAPKPSVLLLDEPFSNLDADIRYKIREELKKIIKKAGITCIFVTHDIEDSKALADRLVMINKKEVSNVVA